MGFEVNFRFFIAEPITFEEKTHTFYAPIGGNATLLCEPNSFPQSTITWTKDDFKIEGIISS